VRRCRPQRMQGKHTQGRPPLIFINLI
jgi:hypothetical protein